jgi:DNA helicase II / ATP-dependent DNA helicase PcrA
MPGESAKLNPGMHAQDMLSESQRRVVAQREGTMLVTGAAGTGRSEALARRLASLVGDGLAPHRILLLARSRAAAASLRSRVEGLLEGAHEELWVATYEEVAERLLREHAAEAALDPFFATVSAADRLAILLDRLDELPLRRHEIRGNPAGLLARLLRRIDALKAEAVSPAGLRDWATRLEDEADAPARRERARRELEFAELYGRHDRILREAGNLDAGDLVLELVRLLRERADIAESLALRFPQVMADELEDAGAAHRALLDALASHGNLVCACDPGQAIRRLRGAGAAVATSFADRYPEAIGIRLADGMRFGEDVGRAADAVLALASDVGAAKGSYRATVEAVAAASAQRDENGRRSTMVRFWRCQGERAEAQAAAREVEHLLATGEVAPDRVCLTFAGGWAQGRLLAAALEERGIPFRFAGDAAFYQRPEVRDALAWLRLLADPGDAAAAVRALTRPPVELRSVDLARVTTIARRRKLEMISALEAALESPQLPPEARDRIQAFLRLYGAAAGALEEMRADVFVRRLIERIGLRRHRLFAASPETAERLKSLSRLAELAAEWARREPRGSVRDFIGHLTAVADAGEVGDDDCEPPAPGAVVVAEPQQLKGLEFDHVYLLGLHQGAIPARPWEAGWVPEDLLAEELDAEDAHAAARRARLAYLAMTRVRAALVMSWPETADALGPSPAYDAARAALGGEEEIHEEELFGPAEGLHATYRLLRDEVLEASWRAGGALSEMRLDTAEDVNRAVARFLELLKLAALIQRPGPEPATDALAALNELLARIASPEQRASLEESALDEYVLGEERQRAARRRVVQAPHEPSLEQFIPRRGEGLALSASDIDLYRTCPLKYKFARVFAIPQEPTINQRFGILVHQVLERFHAEELRAKAAGAQLPGNRPAGSLGRLLDLFEAGWRRAGFGSSDDELQYRDRAVAALTRYHERHARSPSEPLWLERGFSFRIGPHQLRGRVDRVDRRTDGSYELIDYKTGEPKSARELTGDVQLALYRIGAREAWQVEADIGTYWYVLEDERVPVPAAPDDAERVERTVIEVAAGIESQDFEPRPSYEICSWCDYRLICPASEA